MSGSGLLPCKLTSETPFRLSQIPAVIVGSPIGVLEMGEVQAAAHKVGLGVDTFEIRRSDDILPAFTALKDRAKALYVVYEPLVVLFKSTPCDCH